MNFQPELIGVGKYTGELAEWLSGRGFSVEVVTSHPHYPGFALRAEPEARYARSVELGVRITRCPLLLRRGGRGIWRLIAPLSFAISAAPMVLWRALRMRPATILCVEPTLLAAPAAILAAWLIRARLVLHVQDLEVDAAFATGCLDGRALQRLGLWIERRVLRAFDKVVTISEGMADRLAEKGVDRSHVAIVRNWTQPGALSGAADAARLRAQWGIGPDERVILYAGHLGAKQDVPTLLAALRDLALRRPVRVVIVGEGPMASAVAACAIPDLIHMPLQPADTYAALLAMADVHVLSQDARAAGLVFPSKLGPMLATGKPVVVGADAGSDLAGWVGDCAVVVKPGDPSALATGLERALDEPSGQRCERAQALARTLDAGVVLPAFEAHLLGSGEDVGQRVPRLTGLFGRRRRPAAVRV